MITLNETQRRFCADVCGLQVHCIEACGECRLCDDERERNAKAWRVVVMFYPPFADPVVFAGDPMTRDLADRTAALVRQCGRGARIIPADVSLDVCPIGCGGIGLHHDGCPDIG